MGNCQGNPMFSTRNKEFQSVVPFPNANDDNVPALKRRKSSSPNKSHRTAPSPGHDGDSSAVSSSDLPEDVGSCTDKFDVPSSSSAAGPITNETVKCNTSIDSSFMQTESQQRRERMADCEFECSKITSYLFVGGYHVATNRDILKQNGVTHIVNCSAAVVENAFVDDKTLKYLSLSMVDGRQDDISWFLCEVIQFIMKARSVGGKILIHCEKGISRSCSFAIAYRMWATGEKWKTSFDYVKKGRSICSPNTAFTCNLIELGELLGKDAAATGAGGNLFFRCAYHLPHDPTTAVLKLCRTAESRKLMAPSTSLLDPKGVFVIRTVFSHDERVNRDAESHRLFLWQGAESTDGCAKKAEALAKKMHGVLTSTDIVELVKQGEESNEFLSYLVDDGPFSSVDNSLFDDFFDYPPSAEETLISARQMEADHTRNNSKDKEKESYGRPTPLRETSIKGFAEFREGPLSRESSIMSSMPLMSREGSMRIGQGNSSGLQLDLGGGMRGGFASMNNREAKSDRVDTPSSVAPSTTDSRRNSDMSAFIHSRIPSIQLPEAGSVVESEGAKRASPLFPAPADSPLNFHQGSTSTSTTPTNNNNNNNTNNTTTTNNNNNNTVNRRNVPELALTTNNKPASLAMMQRVSEGDATYSEINSSRMNSSRDTGRDSVEVRGAQPTQVASPLPTALLVPTTGKVDSPLLRLDSNKMNLKRLSGETEASPLARDYISPDASTEDLPRKASITLPAIQLPSLLSPQLSLKIPLGTTPENNNSSNNINTNSSLGSSNSTHGNGNTSGHAHGVSPSVTASKPSVPSQGRDEPTSLNLNLNMHRQSSAEKLRPGSREMRLFVSGRVAPAALTESPRNQNTSPRGLDLPPTGGSRPTSATLNLNLNGQSPLTERRIAGSTASALLTLNNNPGGTGTSSNNNSTSNLHNGLVAPLRVLERSPSHERNPLDVGLQRGPTPIEDLVTPRGVPRELNPSTPIAITSATGGGTNIHASPGTMLSPSQIDAAHLRPSPSKASLPELTKPTLFQAVLRDMPDLPRPGKRTASGASVSRYEWQAMGVYDDDDLDASSLFLLLCPGNGHYLWLGSAFPAHEAGIAHGHSESETDEDENPRPADVLQWAAGVLTGEARGDAVGAQLLANPDVRVEMCGDESEDFWQDFNDGF